MTHLLLEALQVNEAQFIALRRQFHQQPEIGFEEHQTSNEVARLLGEWGYEVHRGTAGTGWWARCASATEKNASACGRIWMPCRCRSGAGSRGQAS